MSALGGEQRDGASVFHGEFWSVFWKFFALGCVFWEVFICFYDFCMDSSQENSIELGQSPLFLALLEVLLGVME